MVEIVPPTPERARFLFDYQPDTGRLAWRNPTMRAVSVGDIAGSLGAKGIRYVSVDGRACMAHRLVWLIVHGEWPDASVIALNGDYDDLRLNNLSLRPKKIRSADEDAKIQQRRASELVRFLWKRTRRDYPENGWVSLEQFRNDIGDGAFTHCRVVPVRADAMVGPMNFRIERRAKVDRSTPEGRTAYYLERNRTDRPRYRAHHLKAKFGITPEHYAEMLTTQNGVCAICKKPETAIKNGRVLALSVDHCHGTGVIRELLCRDCNHALGKFQDDPDRFLAAAAYLKRHAAKTSTSVPASNVIPLKLKER